MKKAHLLFALTLGISSLAWAAGVHDHGHEHKPLHGGIVTEVKDMDFELVAKTDSIHLYLRDHGKPVDVSKASAKLTLLSGSQTQEVNLQADSDKLSAKGSFSISSGTKVVAQVNYAGKSINARFALK